MGTVHCFALAQRFSTCGLLPLFTGFAYQVFCISDIYIIIIPNSSKITVMLQLYRSNKIILWLVTTTWGTVLKDHSIREVEKHWSYIQILLFPLSAQWEEVPCDTDISAQTYTSLMLGFSDPTHAFPLLNLVLCLSSVVESTWHRIFFLPLWLKKWSSGVEAKTGSKIWRTGKICQMFFFTAYLIRCVLY